MMPHKLAKFSPPRALKPEERAVLDCLLSADFPGRDMLLIQAESVCVSEECVECKTIVLDVGHELENAAKVKRRVPIEAEAYDIDGVRIHFLLHVVKGYMDELEVFREDLSFIQKFPESDRLTLLSLD